jgi:hypothetical protein
VPFTFVFVGRWLWLFKRIGDNMTNLRFTAMVGAIAAATLGAAAAHYQSPVSVTPAVIVYRDSALQPGQSSPSGDRFWTLAVRSDGANMQTNSAPDASGRIQGVKSVQFQDRYVLVDPSTMSLSTYKPYRPIVVGARGCSGKSAGAILEHPVEYVQVNKPSPSPQRLKEQWLATDLNCLMLREHLIVTKNGGSEMQFFREAVSIKTGEPPVEYFDIPSNYEERGPAEINSEFEKKFPGRHVVSNSDVLDKLEHVYEAAKPPK